MQQLEVARLQDPASVTVLGWLAHGYYLRGQRDSALVLSRQSLQAGSTGPALNTRMGILARYGDRDSARSFARAHPELELSWYALAVTGDTAAAWTRVRELEKRSTDPDRFKTLALLYLGLADTAAALGALERATDARELVFVTGTIVTDPIFDPIRASPRFLALLPRVGLSPDAARITARARSSPAPSPGLRR
jgi:hypothetical protein